MDSVQMDSAHSITPLARSAGAETRPGARKAGSASKKDVLIRQLLALSRAGKVTWAPATESGAFQIAFGQYTVEILASAPNGIDLLVRIVDGQGTVVEEISDGEMAEATGSFYFQTMHELHTLARRSALGADKAIDTLLSLLDENAPRRER